MRRLLFSLPWCKVFALIGLAILLRPGQARATVGEAVIYSFAGDEDGEYPDTDLVMDSSGNLYGTTVSGGQFGSGTVFELKRSDSGWQHIVLYSFTSGPDGGEPYKGVTLDRQGNLFGTAVTGGLAVGPCVDSGCGVVFRLSRIGDKWFQSVIHSFSGGTDGYGPGSGVTLDADGNIYGTTPVGGFTGFGVVYRLKKNGKGNWTENILHTFTGGDDGIGGSAGRLTFDQAGNLYGVCTAGGANGAGTLYQLTPNLDGTWTENTLYAFRGSMDSGFPYGNVTPDGNGNLYGTTYYEGENDFGTVFRLSQANGQWEETGLYSFTGGSDGASPIGALTAGADGNLYGTASEGGGKCGCGTIFKITPDETSLNFHVVYRLKGAPDAAFLYNQLFASPLDGALYGASVHGGAANEGAIYRLNLK